MLAMARDNLVLYKLRSAWPAMYTSCTCQGRKPLKNADAYVASVASRRLGLAVQLWTFVDPMAKSISRWIITVR